MRHFLTVFAFITLIALTLPAHAADKDEIKAALKEILAEEPEILAEPFAKMLSSPGWRLLPHKKALFENPISPIIGNPKGDVTVVEFIDYNCGYCKKASTVVEEVIANDKNVKFIIKELPILHETSHAAAKAALAADRQGKYHAMHVKLMEAKGPFDSTKIDGIAKSVGLNMEQFQKDINDPAIAQETENNRELVGRLGIRGTPAFIIGDNLMPGFLEKPALEDAIANARKNNQE